MPMSSGQRWLLAALGLGIFCLGMLTTVVASRLRAEWVCRKLGAISRELESAAGKLECVAAIEDFVVVRRHGGVGTFGETDERLAGRGSRGGSLLASTVQTRFGPTPCSAGGLLRRQRTTNY